MPKLRVGTVGCGYAAGLHMPGCQALGSDRYEVAAVCGRSQERAGGFADRYGIPRAFESFQDMVSAEEGRRVDVGTALA
jgi:predicted dehydrogenase